ncbi:ATP-dependent DNA ligase [Suillus fuscotomentosus]|uniref:ATP-dependent DNA ligase n=1 Tax=Suillus fuscotomentosus TaxID=1912939 RepID=A0AAD4DT24_9AGAM|nr:ATP-dependent DNA ligase [Suillus fuscotomentosus]KAG1893297.1 ATP-dependent DNA ligase [Suillus fuscotomentosus]
MSAAQPVQIQGSGILVPLREEAVTSSKSVKEVLERGERNRRTTSTDRNERSSRSHSVFRLVVESRERGEKRNETPSGRQTPSTRPSTPGGPRLQTIGGRGVQTSVLVVFISLFGLPSRRQSVYLCINRLSPDYVGVGLGIGESLLIKAISESTGRGGLATVKADLKKEGDLGLVAMNSKNSQKTLFKPKPLTVPFDLREVALSSGHSSQAKKVSIITKLLAACQDFEAKYIVRSLEGNISYVLILPLPLW